MRKENTTIKEMISWLRDDFKTFEIKHDIVHTCLDAKIDNLQNFNWKAIGWGSAFGVFSGIGAAIFLNFETIKKLFVFIWKGVFT